MVNRLRDDYVWQRTEDGRLIQIFSWTTVREGDIGYVKEYQNGSLAYTYGPMPAVILGTFVNECNNRVATVMARLMEEHL